MADIHFEKNQLGGKEPSIAENVSVRKLMFIISVGMEANVGI